jgi:hypothetical protein
MSRLQIHLNGRQFRLLCSSLFLLLSCCNFYMRANQHMQARGSRRLLNDEPQPEPPPLKTKILYIMTSMAEYDNGRRNTKKGYDRFLHTLVPVAKTSVTSMVNAGFHVDFYLISHYPVSAKRIQQLTDALPATTGLSLWDDATPIGYAIEHSVDSIQNITRALARQHRIVIKDKLLDYDFFCNFEDDMLVRAEHVEHFLDVTNQLYRLREAAHRSLALPRTVQEAALDFYGEMTVMQLSRMVPGFIRVEAAVRNFSPKGPDIFSQIPRDFIWNTSKSEQQGVDPSICCHVPPDMLVAASDHMPETQPGAESLYFWETSIDVLGVRQMPEQQLEQPSSSTSTSTPLGWVLLQAGNREDFFTMSEYVIGDYWTGRDGYFEIKERPERSKGRYMNNQGGWMATRRQIYEWQTERCLGGFLPPYPIRGQSVDGLGQESVEYWSGGLQLAGMLSCNLQRIISLEPSGFSRHLLYHTSNNKQRQANVKHRFSSRSINEFWGQLNTIRKNAEKAMKQEMDKQ